MTEVEQSLRFLARGYGQTPGYTGRICRMAVLMAAGEVKKMIQRSSGAWIPALLLLIGCDGTQNRVNHTQPALTVPVEEVGDPTDPELSPLILVEGHSPGYGSYYVQVSTLWVTGDGPWSADVSWNKPSIVVNPGSVVMYGEDIECEVTSPTSISVWSDGGTQWLPAERTFLIGWEGIIEEALAEDYLVTVTVQGTGGELAGVTGQGDYWVLGDPD